MAHALRELRARFARGRKFWRTTSPAGVRIKAPLEVIMATGKGALATYGAAARGRRPVTTAI